jgi:hypothetical protein
VETPTTTHQVLRMSFNGQGQKKQANKNTLIQSCLLRQGASSALSNNPYQQPRKSEERRRCQTSLA